ncbi:MAG: hypothetical protein GX625_20725 [Clostridiaceae bacterium]|nr:hypothetical protein [Clostridiaceae bacterium]
MAQERYIAVYPPALKLPAGGNPATHALEQGMAAWSQQLQQWLSQEVSKILGQATDHGQQIDALENVGKIKARAYRNAAQNIDASGYTKVAIDTVSFDTESVADVTTNNRITPTLPGYYHVTGNVCAIGVPDGERVTAWIYKNGSRVSVGSYGLRQGAGGYAVSITSDLIYMNGTTDYLELYAQNTHSSALALYVGGTISAYNYLSVLGPF